MAMLQTHVMYYYWQQPMVNTYAYLSLTDELRQTLTFCLQYASDHSRPG